MSGRPLPLSNPGFVVIVANLGTQLSIILCAPSRPSPEPSLWRHDGGGSSASQPRRLATVPRPWTKHCCGRPSVYHAHRTMHQSS